ncbi:MAG: hypothetical protein ACAI25_11345 [Planctomycetota bacterium]
MNVRLPVLALAAGLLLVAGAGTAPAGDELDMSTLKVKAPKDWEGEYNKALKSWTYEKYIEVKGDDVRKPNRVYVDILPDDAPTKMKDYADSLKKKDFQDFNFVYTEVTEQTEVDGGFLIKGLVKDHSDKAAKAEPGFVFVKKVKGTLVRVKSGTLVNEDMRKEAIELAKSISG